MGFPPHTRFYYVVHNWLEMKMSIQSWNQIKTNEEILKQSKWKSQIYSILFVKNH